MTRIAICAPGAPITPEVAEQVRALAAGYPSLDLAFHDQCFVHEGHFAGRDALRLAAFLECANDPGTNAVWFAKGGYGSVRLAADALAALTPAARDKTYLGYSDAGTMLAALYHAKIGQPVHGPMPVDVRRTGGEAAVHRALDYLTGSASGLEPSLNHTPAAAFNLMTLAMVCGTDLMPDLAGHVVMVEEVAEHLYAVDRLMFHVTAHLAPMGIAGLRLGAVSHVPENDRPFGAEPEEIARFWCDKSGIAWLGRAQIGHDSANRIVPFGLAERAATA